MTEFMPVLAPIVVLLFLGTVFVLAISVLLVTYGAVRRSNRIAAVGAGATLIIAGGYAFLLCGVSLASSEKTLPPGGWKYFCEIDCHIAYSVLDARRSAAIGPELGQVRADGQFVIVSLKAWFDERTISAHRGNGPLTPNPRRVALVDDTGRQFAVSSRGEAALASSGSTVTPLAQALRPGESYVTDLAFDVPKDARGLRLLIADDDPESHLLIGHENSPLHKKIYLSTGL